MGETTKIIKLKPGESVQIVCEESVQPTPQPTPSPTPDGEEPMYRVGMWSDQHFDSEDTHNSEYVEDSRNSLRFFEREGAAFISSLGDFCQYKDKDLELFRDFYDSKLPLYCCLGNHDYLRVASKRDAAHAIPSQYKNGFDMWEQCVGKFHGDESRIHFFDPSTDKGRLTYWVEKMGDVHVYLSIDYGVSLDRYDVLRGINHLDYTDPNVQALTTYVSDTSYDRNREHNFDYQFFEPAHLIWLKSIVEKNPYKRIILHVHLFMLVGAGDTADVYKHLRIWPFPTSEEIRDKWYSGSNTICGLTFWYFDKLLSHHLNIIVCGGHTHFETGAQVDFVHRQYKVIQPIGNEVTPLVDDLNSLSGGPYDYDYYHTVGHSIGESAPTVHLPSLSKPCTASGQALYGASEGVVMDMFKDCVKLRYIRFKAEGSTVYTNELVNTLTINIANDDSPVVEPDMPYVPTFEGIRVVFHNLTGQDIRFTGKYHMYLQEETEAIPLYLNPPTMVDEWCHWDVNDHQLKAGAEVSYEFIEIVEYTAVNGHAVPTRTPLATILGKHFRTADTAEWPAGIAAIKFGVRAFARDTGKYSTGAAMIQAQPISEADCLVRAGATYHINLLKIKDNATLDTSWMSVPYQNGDQYKYVIT